MRVEGHSVGDLRLRLVDSFVRVLREGDSKYVWMLVQGVTGREVAARSYVDSVDVELRGFVLDDDLDTCEVVTRVDDVLMACEVRGYFTYEGGLRWFGRRADRISRAGAPRSSTVVITANDARDLGHYSTRAALLMLTRYEAQAFTQLGAIDGTYVVTRELAVTGNVVLGPELFHIGTIVSKQESSISIETEHPALLSSLLQGGARA